MPNLAASSESTVSLLDRLDELSELRPFPAVANRLMAACEDPDCDSRILGQIIRCDGSLALRFLRVANSSMYGFSREINTIEAAVVVLGFKAVKNLAISIAAAEVFDQGSSAHQARLELWQHSLGTATVAKLLANQLADVNSEEAFLAGIVHDVGKLIFFDVVPDDYLALNVSLQNESIVDAEVRTFGITHEQIGKECGEEWGLPDEIIHAIANHHSPASAADCVELVSLISLANSISKIWGLGVNTPLSADLEEVLANSGVSLTLEQLQQVELQAQAEFEAVRQACTQ